MASIDRENKAFLSFFQPGASLLEAALAYASLRLFVHPLKVGSKQPATSHGWHDATTKTEQIKSWWGGGIDFNIGLALRYSGLAVLDVDPRSGGNESLQSAIDRHGDLPDTYSVQTSGGGTHFYFRVSPDFYESNDLPKVLAPGLELLTNHYVVAPPSTVKDKWYVAENGAISEHFSQLPIPWMQRAAIDTINSKHGQSSWSPDDENWSIPVGERNDTLTAIAGWARAKGLNQEEIEGILEVLGGRVEDFSEVVDELPTIARSVMRYQPNEVRFADLKLTVKPRNREPMFDRTALRGPIGKWVESVEPLTEAHPAALMTQALCAFGNIIGATQKDVPAPGFFVEDTHHRTALYVTIIGQSAKSGKGDSWSRVRALMSRIDPKWSRAAGVQTGEGLIDSLADDQLLKETTVINGEKHQHVKKGGQVDRRFLIVEPEFGRTLHASDRKGSTLKDVYRDLWDEGSTSKITAGSKQTVSDATVSLIAHITKPELERDIDPVDLMSGFGNRFLYVYTKRTKILAHAESLTHRQLERYATPLRYALDFAREEAPEDYEFTDAAWRYWERLCKAFAKNHPNPLIDSLTARARPIVRRLAVIYAVAECSLDIDVQHLEAAYALWQYCEDTVQYIFSDYIGDRDADKIMRALLEHRAGLSKVEINTGVFNRNVTSARIESALRKLSDRGLIWTRREKRARKTIEVFVARTE